MSRRLKANLFMLAIVALAGATLAWLYRPRGYRYDFSVVSRSVEPGTPAKELRWDGYGLERRREILHLRFSDAALRLTKESVLPGIDRSGGFTSLRRTNKHSSLGDGGVVAGHRTRVVRYIDHDTLYVTDSAGRHLAHANRVITDYYVADDVGETARKFSRLADSINLVLAGLTPAQARERISGRASTYKGVPLRIVSNVEWVDANRTTRHTTTESVVHHVAEAPVSSDELHALVRASEVARREARRNGWAYSFTVTTPDTSSGAPLRGHAEVLDDVVRISFEGRGHRERDRRDEYLLVTDGGRQVAIVKPSERQYSVITADSLARTVQAGLSAVSRFVDVKLGGLQVEGTRIGDADTIAGHATERYRMSQRYRIEMRVFGARPTLRGTLTADFWVSPTLRIPGNPFFDFIALIPNALAMQSADYVRESVAARARLFGSLPLRTVATLDMTDADGKVTRSVTTIEVSEVRRASLEPGRFEIPASYKAGKGGAVAF